MSDKLDTRVIQITNVAPGATREQMKTLFAYIGHIDELKLYPPEESEVQVPARVCYIKYEDTTSVGVALHLTNTVFIDRALIVVPVMDGKIPDEQTALQMAPSAIAGMMPGQPTWPSNVMSQLQGTGTNQVITTNDPRLTAHGLPQYPPLPGSTDPAKIEEIRRTVVVGNLDPVTTGEHVLSFFSQVGEIKYVKLSEDSDGTRIALVEFSDQRSIASALTYSGVMFQNKPLRVTHSYSSIIKPQNKHQQAAQREIEEAMKKVKEAQSLITAAADMGDINIDKTVSKLANDLHSSRSRSRSKSKKRRSRSRSKHRSRSKSHKSRSRSRQRSKSRRSRSKRRSRSRSKKQKSRSRSKSKSKSRRNRSRSRSRRQSSRSRRSRSQSRKQRSKSRSRRRSRSSKRSLRKSRSRSRKRSISKSKRLGSPEKIKVSESVEKKSKSRSLSPPKLEREGSVKEESSSRRSSEDTKTDELSSSKKSSPPVPVVKSSPPAPEVKRSSSRARSRSRSHRTSSRRSRSRSGSRHRSRKGSRRSRSRSRKRSRSRRRSRSRSGSRHRSRKDKKRDNDRSRGRSRDKDKEKSKRKHKEKEKDKDDKKDFKVTRNYDEEEQTIYDDSAQANAGRSTGDRDQMDSRDGRGTTSVSDTMGDDSNLQQIDMDMSD